MGQRIAKDVRRLSDVDSIRALPAPAKGNKVYYDDDLAGFGVRVTATGSKAFVFNYRTKDGQRERRITIGRPPNWTIGAARTKAKELRRLVDNGDDPLGDIEDARAAPTVPDLIARFESEHLTRRRASTVADYRSILSKHIGPALKHLKVREVTFLDVERLHHKVTAAGFAYRANRVVAILSKMFSLAVRWGMRDDNPCRGIEKNKEYERRRYLKPDELLALVKALAEYPKQQPPNHVAAAKDAVNIIRLLLLCGVGSPLGRH